MFDSSEKWLAETYFFGLLEFIILVTEFGDLESRRRLLFTELGVQQFSSSAFMAAS